MKHKRLKVNLTWTYSVEVELPENASTEDYIDYARMEVSSNYDGAIQYLLGDAIASLEPVVE